MVRGDLPGGPVVETSPSDAGRSGTISGWGSKIPHALWQEKKKKEAILQQVNKDF